MDSPTSCPKITSSWPLDEPPLVGRGPNREAWHGYFSSLPEYVIYPCHIAACGSSVAVLGTTTGSHLGLPDDEEMKLNVVWLAEVDEGHLTRWHVADDTPELRDRAGIPLTA
jgi:hypothetical protein